MFNEFDDIEEIFDDHGTAEQLNRLSHLASELMQEFNYASEKQFEQAMLRAFDACTAMHISIEMHFQKIYVERENVLIADWQISDLGCYLLLINGEPSNPKVAEAQLYLLSKKQAKQANASTEEFNQPAEN